MNQEKMIKISIPSELGYEKTIIATVTSMAEKMKLSSRQIDNLKTAVGEAVTNAIEHGNQLNCSLKVLTTIHIREEVLTLTVADHGQQPLPNFIPPRQNRTDNRDWGIFLIRNLMDKVKVTAAPGRNELQMVMYVTPKRKYEDSTICRVKQATFSI